MIAEDVAMIKVSEQDQGENEDIMIGDMMMSFPGSTKDTQVINADKYEM